MRPPRVNDKITTGVSAIVAVSLVASMTFPLTSTAYADAASSSDRTAPSNTSDEPAKAIEGQLSFVEQTVYIPYGVNIDEWLARADVKILQDESGQLFSAKELSSLFEKTTPPLRYTGQSYPAADLETPQSISGLLQWGTLAAGAPDIELPDLATLDLQMTQLANEGASLPLAPDIVCTRLLAITDDKGDASWRLAGSAAEGTRKLWVNANDAVQDDGVSIAASQNSELKATVSLFASLDAQGAFSNTEPVKVRDAGCVFVKLPCDVTTVDKNTGRETTLCKGQVVRLPVVSDKTSPEIGAITVSGADGTPLDLASMWTDGNRLSVGSTGITITAPITDGAEDGQAEPSGIATVQLRVGKGQNAPHFDATSFEDGVARFALDIDTLGAEGVYELSQMAIETSDAAGNISSKTLAQASPLAEAGIKFVELIDEQAADNKPQASIAATSVAGEDDGVQYVTSAGGTHVTFRVLDKRLSDLLAKESWLSSEPLSYMVNDGEKVLIDPSTLQVLGSESNLYQSTQALDLVEEGRYKIEFDYTGAARYFIGIPIGSFKDSTSADIVVDRTAPQVESVELSDGYDEDAELARSLEQLGGANALIGAERTIDVRIDDLPGSSAPAGAETSGLSSARIEWVRHDRLDATDTGKTEKRDATSSELKDGVLHINLDEQGIYRLSDINLVLHDSAGNERTVNLAEHLSTLPEEQRACWNFSTIIVDENDQAKTGLSVSSATDAKDRAGTTVCGKDVNVTAWIANDPLAFVYAKTDAFKHNIGVSLKPDGVNTPAGELTFGEMTYDDATGRWDLPLGLPKDAQGAVLNGRYELSFAYRDVEPATQDFIVDSHAPQLTDVRLEGSVDENADIAHLGSRSVLVGTERSIRVRVQDLLDATDSSGKRDQEHTSGVKAEQTGTDGRPQGDAVVTLSLSCTPSLNPSDTPEKLSDRIMSVGEDGWTTIEFDEAGVYDLNDIVFTVEDNAGNTAQISLCDYIAALPAEERAAWNFDAILVDSEQSASERSVSLTVQDAPGTPESEDAEGYYHRGTVDVEVSVQDRWFEAYRAIASRQEGFFTISCITDEGTALDAEQLPALSPADFTYDASRDAWTATLRLRSAGANRPEEGSYEVKIDYQGISGSSAQTQAAMTFGIDYTAPEFGELALSKTSPQRWGWLFPHDEETLSVEVADNFAGIEPAGAGTLRTKDGQSHTTDLDNGKLSFTFDDDAERLNFDQARITVKDRAGNTRALADIKTYAHGNIPTNADAFSVDVHAPRIDIVYDNDDVRNGRYYNAARTATITVTEANFDLLKAHDPKRVIAKASCDGIEDELRAEDFENPSKDGVTWVCSYTFERDGDCTLDASFSDPAGRPSNVVHDEFTIDTTAPVLLVTFDNNEVQNGMYYKERRTASIEVSERNFDTDLTSIETTAANGNVPAPTGWKSDGRNGHVNSVHFGDETHYTLRVSVTDLAGNEADVFEEPEFVIDLTAPQVAIDDVSNNTAYAGTVAPSIDYSDLNFDPLATTYELEGARQGMAFMGQPHETQNETSKHVQFADFERSIEFDDVYTLTAKVTDLAGNESTDTVRFSVNRFGSNYILVGASRNTPGSYLDEARDLQIAEINVSGLQTGKTHAELVHDSRTVRLSPEEDYTAKAGTAQGWSETLYTFPARLFDADGYYRVLLTSRDRAGNLSQNTMPAKDEKREGTAEVNFAIDTTSPSSSVIGIEPGGVYLQPEMQVEIDSHDNLAVEKARLLVDGTEVASWSGAQDGSVSAQHTLVADGTPHTISLETTDRAGNTRTTDYRDVVVAGDWVAFIRNTPQLLYPLVASGIALLAGIAIGAVLFTRHRRDSETTRNPFGHSKDEA